MKLKHTKHLLPVVLAGILTTFIFAITVHGEAPISESFTSSDQIPVGSIVSLKSGATDQVVPSLNNNVDGLFGVVIDSGNSLLSISNSNNISQVQVATGGSLQVLVSDINGEVRKGDHITASPIAGVGMKATDNVRIVGIAQDDLTIKNGNQQTYNTASGKKQSLLVGPIPVLVNVSYYFKEPDKTLVPSAIQNMANALAGKNVSSLPIIISMAIFVIMIIVVSSIIYAMIRNSIISVGRNPMSQSAIYRDLIQLSVLVIVILAVGIAAIYLVLTRM